MRAERFSDVFRRFSDVFRTYSDDFRTIFGRVSGHFLFLHPAAAGRSEKKIARKNFRAEGPKIFSRPLPSDVNGHFLIRFCEQINF